MRLACSRRGHRHRGDTRWCVECWAIICEGAAIYTAVGQAAFCSGECIARLSYRAGRLGCVRSESVKAERQPPHRSEVAGVQGARSPLEEDDMQEPLPYCYADPDDDDLPF